MNVAPSVLDVPFSLAALAAMPRWVAWQTEEREPGKPPTKVPYSPRSRGKASADDAATWGTRPAAEKRARMLPKPLGAGGVGIELGDLADGRCIGGVDLDTCRDPDGALEPWATHVIERLATYAEVSPSATGVKLFFCFARNELPAIRAAMGTDHGKMWKRPAGGEHPPAIELHIGNRYFAVTDEHLAGTPNELRPIPLATLLWLIREAGPEFVGNGAASSPAGAIADRSRSAVAFRKGAALRRDGATLSEMRDALRADPETADWVAEKGDADGGRELRRIWERASDGDAPPDPELLAHPDMTVLRLGRRAPPELPLAVFGDAWSAWIGQTAAAAACPPDNVAAPLLASVSALIGHARWALATPGWSEPPHLWLGVVGDSGTGKSPGADALLRDVLPEIERRMSRDFPDRLAQWRAAAETHAAAVDVWKGEVKTAQKTGHPAPMPPGNEAPAEPQAPRLRQNDVTIEKVASLLASAAPKGLLMVRDELAGWLMGMNAYNDAGRAFWIEAYGGRPYRVERQKHPVPIEVPRLAVAVTGGTQPDKLAELFRDADDGLLARIAWAWPNQLPFRLGRAAPRTEWAIEALDRLRLLDLAASDQPGQAPKPIMVPLADEAVPEIEAFAQDMQARQEEAGGLMRSAFGKARGLALRVSLVLEFLWWCGRGGMVAPPVRISREAFGDAAHLVANYLMPMAERVYGDAATRPEDRDAATLARWIVKTCATEVHVRKMQREVRLPGLGNADAIHAAAAVLVAAGWLMPPPAGGFQNRPRAAYAVNNAVFAEASA